MAIQQVTHDGPGSSMVHVLGEPTDIPQLIRAYPGNLAVMIAGYDVTSTGDGLHDGHPALRFTLSVDSREVGRLVVMTGIATEYSFEFDLDFDDAADAEEFIENVHRKPAFDKHDVVETTQDLAYEDETLEQAIAGMSAAYGVSISVINPSGSGGGWPVVKILGRYENVHEMLCIAWQYSKADADRMLTAV
jgi:hypothetical protein